MRRPSCPTGERQVAGDFTPRNLRLVQLPDQVKVTRESRNQSLPLYLQRFHGDQSGRLTFVTLLREPLSLMQSLWYHSKANYWLGPCRECKGSSFNSALQRALDKTQNVPIVYEDWVWMGMFGHHLSQWLDRFDARQFFVVPYKYYAADPDVMCEKLSKHMQYKLDCSKVIKATGETTHANGHEHPPLIEDTTALQRDQYADVFEEEHKKLIKTLRAAHHAGATFFHFDPPKGKEGTAKENGEDSMTVEDWLKEGWGGSSAGHKSSKFFTKKAISWSSSSI